MERPANKLSVKNIRISPHFYFFTNIYGGPVMYWIGLAVLLVVIIIFLATRATRWAVMQNTTYVAGKVPAKGNSSDGKIVYLGQAENADQCQALADAAGMGAWTWHSDYYDVSNPYRYNCHGLKKASDSTATTQIGMVSAHPSSEGMCSPIALRHGNCNAAEGARSKKKNEGFYTSKVDNNTAWAGYMNRSALPRVG